MLTSGLQQAKSHVHGKTGSATGQEFNHLSVQVGLSRDSAAVDQTQNRGAKARQLFPLLLCGDVLSKLLEVLEQPGPLFCQDPACERLCFRPIAGAQRPAKRRQYGAEPGEVHIPRFMGVLRFPISHQCATPVQSVGIEEARESRHRPRRQSSEGEGSKEYCGDGRVVEFRHDLEGGIEQAAPVRSPGDLWPERKQLPRLC